MSAPLYLDTSAVLRALLESGTSPQVEERIKKAPLLVTSRLSLVEAARAVHQLRSQGNVSEQALADASRELDNLWTRCEVWGLTSDVCELAERVAPWMRSTSRLISSLEGISRGWSCLPKIVV